MNRLTFFLTTLAIVLLASCDNTPKFTVQGDVKGAQDSTLYFYHNSLTGFVTLDSVRLDSVGNFSFKAAKPEAPDFYALRIGSQLIHISIDSTETVTLHAQYPGMAANYEVEGSESCQRIRQLALRHQQLQEDVYALERNTSLMGQQMVDSLQSLIEAYKDSVRTQFIYAAPERPEAYFALVQVLQHIWWAPQTLFTRNDPADIRAFGAVATCWDTYYPNALRTEHLHNTAIKGMTERRQADAIENQTIDPDKVVVAGIIDISLPDDQGHQRTLSELAGKVVLLDFNVFSADVSGPRILNLRQLYDRYHSQGLEVYQVSPDEDIHLWRQAVETLPWICVHDDTGQSLRSYNVQELPELFLIDRNNTIYKRSTQMDDIETEIRRLL